MIHSPLPMGAMFPLLPSKQSMLSSFPCVGAPFAKILTLPHNNPSHSELSACFVVM
ncbi:hypothetical protein KVMX100_120669 [Klebsiella variicola]|nr:hypothetical protein KVMX100_120669 [Klebsiella variicola]